jgi:hypothetical protein
MSEEQIKGSENEANPAPVHRDVLPRLIHCNPDYRRDPKTDRYCWHCQRDLANNCGSAVNVVFDSMAIVHPMDKHLVESESCLMGPECLRSQSVPVEFCE